MSLPDALSTIALAMVAASVILSGSAIYCCKLILKAIVENPSKK